MSETFEKELFSEIEEFFSSRGMEIFYDDMDGKRALVMEYGPEIPVEDCSITVGQLNESSTSVYLLFSVAEELSEENRDNADKLLLYLNKFLTVGNFGMIRDIGYFYFNCSFIADTNDSIEQVMKLFLVTWETAFDTAVQGAQTVLPVFRGEIPVNELMNDDISIIQFD